jgi:hypothetical protein
MRLFFAAPHRYIVSLSEARAEMGGPDGTEELICPICYSELDIDPGQFGVETALADMDKSPDPPTMDQPLTAKKVKKCMKTPCKHFYHQKCLETWMDKKMECPTCRTSLPPY